MSENAPYTPPKVWVWDKENGGKWAGLLLSFFYLFSEAGSAALCVAHL
jgi:hypothetical protein